MKWTTSLDQALADPANIIYFDSQTTDRRVEGVKKAIAAGKHVYCEKPTATNTAQAYELYTLAQKAGSAQSANTVLLGAACAVKALPFGMEVLERSVRKYLKPALAEVNLKALELGAKATLG